MPRRGRLHVIGGYYHVIGRGLERRYIFSEDEDKEDFLARLGENLNKSESQCLAWAIMSNHYHLLIRVGPNPLSSLMSSLLGGFASGYNRRHRRAGYVFQNRFQSILCDQDRYLLELIRYIHLNPVRAKMIVDCAHLDAYPWTGHSGLLGRHKRDWHQCDDVLKLFGRTSNQARLAYREFITAGIKPSPTNNLSGGGLIRSNGGWESVAKQRKEHLVRIGDERILGDSNFVEQALSQDELKLESKTQRNNYGWTLEKLIERTCKTYGVSDQKLISKARGNSLAIVKSLVCYWGVNDLGLTRVEISLRLKVSPQAVSKWVEKGRVYCNLEQLKVEEFID